jgi:hypothetical protein
MLEANGMNGRLILDGDKITIQRKGFRAFIFQGALKGDKDIYINQISSIQFKKAGLMNNGYIEFAFMGGQESHGGLLNAYGNENTVNFNHKQEKDFLILKEALDKAIRNSRPGNQNTSNLDELEKLAGLRDRGVVSQEEFDVKKKQILSK